MPVGRVKPRRTKPDEVFAGLRRQISTVAGFWQKLNHPFNLGNLNGWAQRVADRFIHCGLVFILALILETGLVYLGKMMWYLYTATPVGQYYLEKMAEHAEPIPSFPFENDDGIQRVLDADPLLISWNSTLTAMWVGFLIGCATQLFHLIRYLYDSQGIIGKLIIWFIPSAGLSAWLIGQQDPFPDYSSACALVALPTLCVLPGCLRFAQAAVPELGVLLKIISAAVANKEKTWNHILKKIRLWLDTTGQVD